MLNEECQKISELITVNDRVCFHNVGFKRDLERNTTAPWCTNM
jgi:hypothetical protein